MSVFPLSFVLFLPHRRRLPLRPRRSRNFALFLRQNRGQLVLSRFCDSRSSNIPLSPGRKRCAAVAWRWEFLRPSPRSTRWRQTISDPKSKASRNWVPIIPALRRELEAYKSKWRPAKPTHEEDGNEIADTALFPMDLVFLGRTTIREACERAKVEWRGWHALRRGLASNLFALGASDLIVQRVLRHSKVIVTRESYIKLRDRKLDAAMAQLSREVAKFGAVKERKKRSTPRRPRKHIMGA